MENDRKVMKDIVFRILLILFLLFCTYVVVRTGEKRERAGYERVTELRQQEISDPNIWRVTVMDETGSRRTYIGEIKILDNRHISLDGAMESCDVICQ